MSYLRLPYHAAWLTSLSSEINYSYEATAVRFSKSRCSMEASLHSPTVTQFDSAEENDQPPTMVSPSSLKSGEMAFFSKEEKEDEAAVEYEGGMSPFGFPFSKVEEKELKRVRRRIKNKISAQESRRRKKEYIDNLEKRTRLKDREILELKQNIEAMENKMRLMVDELFRLKQSPLCDAMSSPANEVPRQAKLVTRATQTGMCLQCYFQGTTPPLSQTSPGYGVPLYQHPSQYSLERMNESLQMNPSSFPDQSYDQATLPQRNSDDLPHQNVQLSPSPAVEKYQQHLPSRDLSKYHSADQPSNELVYSSALHRGIAKRHSLGSDDYMASTNKNSGRKSFLGHPRDSPKIVYKSENVILIKDSAAQNKRKKHEDIAANQELPETRGLPSMRNVVGFQSRSSGLSGHNINTGHIASTGHIATTNHNANTGHIASTGHIATSGHNTNTGLQSPSNITNSNNNELIYQGSRYSRDVFPVLNPVGSMPWEEESTKPLLTASRRSRSEIPVPSCISERNPAETDHYEQGRFENTIHDRLLKQAQNLSSSWGESGFSQNEGWPNGYQYDTAGKSDFVNSLKRRRYFSDSDELAQKKAFDASSSTFSSSSNTSGRHFESSSTAISMFTQNKSYLLNSSQRSMANGMESPVFVSPKPDGRHSSTGSEESTANERYSSKNYSNERNSTRNARETRSVIVACEESMFKSDLPSNISNQEKCFYPNINKLDLPTSRNGNNMNSRQSYMSENLEDAARSGPNDSSQKTPKDLAAHHENTKSSFSNSERSPSKEERLKATRETALARAEIIISNAANELQGASLGKAKQELRENQNDADILQFESLQNLHEESRGSIIPACGIDKGYTEWNGTSRADNSVIVFADDDDGLIISDDCSKNGHDSNEILAAKATHVSSQKAISIQSFDRETERVEDYQFTDQRQDTSNKLTNQFDTNNQKTSSKCTPTSESAHKNVNSQISAVSSSKSTLIASERISNEKQIVDKTNLEKGLICGSNRWNNKLDRSENKTTTTYGSLEANEAKSERHLSKTAAWNRNLKTNDTDKSSSSEGEFNANEKDRQGSPTKVDHCFMQRDADTADNRTTTDSNASRHTAEMQLPLGNLTSGFGKMSEIELRPRLPFVTWHLQTGISSGNNTRLLQNDACESGRKFASPILPMPFSYQLEQLNNLNLIQEGVLGSPLTTEKRAYFTQFSSKQI